MAGRTERELEEMKADGENSESADPVVGAGGPVKMRRADLKRKVNPTIDDIEDDVKTPGMKEALDALFGDTDLTEDFKDKTRTIFEAALSEKTESIEAALTEKYEALMAEDAENTVNELVEKIDSYLKLVINEWTEENKVALEAGYKVTMAEEFFTEMKSLMGKYNFSIDEDTDNTIRQIEEQANEAVDQYNSLVEKYLALQAEVVELKSSAVFEVVAEGLASTDTDRFQSLTENVEFVDTDSYIKKLSTIKETFFGSKSVTRSRDTAEMLDEEVITERKTPVNTSSPYVNASVEALNRLVVRK